MSMYKEDMSCERGQKQKFKEWICRKYRKKE